MDSVTLRDFDNPSPDAVLSLVSFGTWFSLLLTGQSAQEAYTYFRRYPKDGYDLKALVGALSLTNALHASFMIHVNYSLGMQYGSHTDITLGALQRLWSFWVLEATACIIILISHFFFARRVYKREPLGWPVGGRSRTSHTAIRALRGGYASRRTSVHMLCLKDQHDLNTGDIAPPGLRHNIQAREVPAEEPHRVQEVGRITF